MSRDTRLDRLERTTFTTSREMDFFSERELVTQTGHAPSEWPLVIVKELVDNALDACEEANVPPRITVSVQQNRISVADNGPGIPDDTIESALNFRVRASNREAYVAPDRGAQGNALKTLLAMPRVVDPAGGRLLINVRGYEHTIACSADPVTQRPVIKHDRENSKPNKTGTRIAIAWTRSEWPFAGFSPGRERNRRSVLQLLEGFALFNPHMTLTVHWFGERVLYFRATNPAWQKWRPYQPTSPHWYQVKHLERLIGAYIAHDRDRGADRTVADFVAEFDGLTGTQKRKKVIAEIGMNRLHLSGLAIESGLRTDMIAKLLEAMQRHARPVKPKYLGIVGRDHLAQRFEQLGCDPEQFQYRKIAKVDGGLPVVIETAFSWRGEQSENSRLIYAGANWSSAIKNPFRSFGDSSEGLEAILTDLRAGANEPIVFALHVAHPRVEYVDRGKSAMVIGGGPAADRPKGDE